MAQATERQQEVLDLIEQGKSVAEMARALDLTENGVRSHIKRLKQRGLVAKNWPRNRRGGRRRSSNGRGRTAASRPDRATAVSGSNGSLHLDGIPALDEAIKQMAERKTSLSEEVESIDARMKELAEEEAVLTGKRDELSTEAERLRKVEDALAGAVA